MERLEHPLFIRSLKLCSINSYQSNALEGHPPKWGVRALPPEPLSKFLKDKGPLSE